MVGDGELNEGRVGASLFAIVSGAGVKSYLLLGIERYGFAVKKLRGGLASSGFCVCFGLRAFDDFVLGFARLAFYVATFNCSY